MFSLLFALVLASDTAFQHLGATPPPHGLPKITAYSLSATDLHAGQRVTGSVDTSTNVGYVEARIEYRSIAMTNNGHGHFSLVYTIPWWLPPWLRHAYTLELIARSVDGVETKRELPISVH